MILLFSCVIPADQSTVTTTALAGHFVVAVADRVAAPVAVEDGCGEDG
jgi:hypothetical protein